MSQVSYKQEITSFFVPNTFLHLRWIFSLIQLPVSPQRSYLRSRKNVGFCPIDSNRNFCTRGAEFLEQSAISTNPQIFLGYFHLEQETDQYTITWIRSTGVWLRVISFLSSYRSFSSIQLTAQRYPDPGVVSSPSSSLAIRIM